MKISFDPHDPDDIQAAMAIMEIIAHGRVLSPSIETPAPPAPPAPVAETPAPPAPPAPVAETPAPPAPDTSGEDLDADDIPWDSEIHASTKKKTKDGRWRRKRGAKKKAPPRASAPVAETPAPPAPTAATWSDAREAIAGVTNRAGFERRFEEETGIDLIEIYGKTEHYADVVRIAAEFTK